MKRKTLLKSLFFVSILFIGIGLGVSLKLDWPGSSHAQNQQMLYSPPNSAPESFSKLAEKAQPSVVNISTTKKISSSPFMHYYGYDSQESLSRPNSLGSGFVIDSNGYIITNNHVVKNADEIQVILADGRSFDAKIVGRDAQLDIAVIKISPPADLPAVKMGDSDQLKIGDWLVAVGNPFGLGHTVTAGILSARGRVIGAGPYDNFLQTDASINPGNSGGPLFNLNGEVIGVNTAIIRGGQGIGFAIPINMAKTIIPQLIKKGKVERGYLGVGLKEIDADLAKRLGLKQPMGALVAMVYAGTPAQKAGLKAGDIITKFNQKPILHKQDLPIYVSQSPVGSAVEVEVLREGKEQTLRVILGSLESDRQTASLITPNGERKKLGISVRKLNSAERKQNGLSSDEGIIIVAVERNSPAASLGLQAGDIILQINNQSIYSTKDFVRAFEESKQGDMLHLSIKRGPMMSYYSFTL
ncbi:MAG: DegQ family serine endoprotease [Deltaproteobacteria bacterium]|nr:DegQ family serine endoprotease [Deltaproteobacteria bacterium]